MKTRKERRMDEMERKKKKGARLEGSVKREERKKERKKQEKHKGRTEGTKKLKKKG